VEIGLGVILVAGLLGQGSGGLDYASSEKKYHVTAYEDESFSGLHVMCLRYVGFQCIASDGKWNSTSSRIA